MLYLQPGPGHPAWHLISPDCESAVLVGVFRPDSYSGARSAVAENRLTCAASDHRSPRPARRTNTQRMINAHAGTLDRILTHISEQPFKWTGTFFHLNIIACYGFLNYALGENEELSFKAH